MKVVFQGELGAYSELAALSFFPGAEISGLRTLVDVFEAVHNQEALVAVIPVENSSIGPITQCYDLLDEYDFEIFGELITPIRHCLVAHQQCHIENVEAVYSHPAALSQCQRYLNQQGDWEIRATLDTAGSAQLIKEKQLLNVAAIAAENAAEIYGLKILLRDIHDYKHNETRFLVVGKPGTKPVKDSPEKQKTTLAIRLEHRAGALSDCLSVLGMLKINLSALISRPDKNNAWSYVFFLDLLIRRDDPRFQLMLDNFHILNIRAKFLGDYADFTYTA
jgi:prephenate dehydratase